MTDIFAAAAGFEPAAIPLAPLASISPNTGQLLKRVFGVKLADISIWLGQRLK